MQHSADITSNGLMFVAASLDECSHACFTQLKQVSTVFHAPLIRSSNALLLNLQRKGFFWPSSELAV